MLPLRSTHGCFLYQAGLACGRSTKHVLYEPDGVEVADNIVIALNYHFYMPCIFVRYLQIATVTKVLMCGSDTKWPQSTLDD